VTTATAPDGRRVHVVHNWSWEPTEVTVPAELADALRGDPVRAGSALPLTAWDVRVLATVPDADRPR
jgi:beta-galactosidase